MIAKSNLLYGLVSRLIVHGGDKENEPMSDSNYLGREGEFRFVAHLRTQQLRLFKLSNRPDFDTLAE